MPETKQMEFTHKEVAEALLRGSDIHEGLWGLYIVFGLAGANVSQPPGNDINPAAIVPVLKLGLQRFEKPNNMTVDAAMINPLRRPSPQKQKKPRQTPSPPSK